MNRTMNQEMKTAVITAGIAAVEVTVAILEAARGCLALAVFSGLVSVVTMAAAVWFMWLGGHLEKTEAWCHGFDAGWWSAAERIRGKRAESADEDKR